MPRRSWCWLVGVLLLAAACSASPSEETAGSSESPRDVVTTPTSQPPARPEAEHRMRGTDGDDRIVGTSGRDAINGLRGADVIRGGAGDDVLRDYSGVGTGRPLDTSRDALLRRPG